MGGSATTAYLDCFSGISGDMLLGALIACGLSPERLRAELAKLKLEAHELTITRVRHRGLGAVSVTVSSAASQSFTNLSAISHIINGSSLAPCVKERSLRVFERLAAAEAKVHDQPINQVHFHEVGALDTVIDVVGCVAGLHLLGIETVHCSPLPLARGFVRCAHGILPLPAPAVCELLSGVEVYGLEGDRELVTPTGAALAVELAERFGPLTSMTIQATGYGAGDSPGTDDRPNLLRLITGIPKHCSEAQTVEVIETHLDDWSPEGFPYLCARLFEHHALDVALSPIIMKKSRPGFCLRVIARSHDSFALKEIILSETTAIGLRFRFEHRLTLPREAIHIDTDWGPVAAKKVSTPAGIKVYPEYEACRAVAEEHGVPLDQVFREVVIGSKGDC